MKWNESKQLTHMTTTNNKETTTELTAKRSATVKLKHQHETKCISNKCRQNSEVQISTWMHIAMYMQPNRVTEVNAVNIGWSGRTVQLHANQPSRNTTTGTDHKCNHYNVYEVQTTESKFTMKSKCKYQHWCTAVRQTNQGWNKKNGEWPSSKSKACDKQIFT